MKISYLYSLVVIAGGMMCGMECTKDSPVIANTTVTVSVKSALQDVRNVAISLRGTVSDAAAVQGIKVYLYKKSDYSASTTTLTIEALKLKKIDAQDSNANGTCSFTIKESGEYVLEAYYKVGETVLDKRKSVGVSAAPGTDKSAKSVELLLD